MGLLQDILDSQFRDAHEKAKRKQNGAEEPSLLGALKDPQFRQDVKRGLLDAANRGGVAMTVGAPADIGGALMNSVGMAGSVLGHKLGLLSADQMYQPVEPTFGSEWWGKQMQDRGMVSENRNMPAEVLSSLLVPGAMTKAGQGLFKAEQAAIQNAKIAGPLSDSRLASQRGVFGGLNAKTADKAKLAQAEQMLNKGVDPAQVWKETGWGRGPDGKWRFEIPDDAAKFSDKSERTILAQESLGKFNPQTVRSVMKHEPLNEAYGFDTLPINVNGKGGSSYSPASWDIEHISLGEGGKSTLLHELQHAIQQREGFARGGSPEQFANAKKEADAAYRLFHDTYKANEAEYLARTKGLGQPSEKYASLSTDTIKANMDGAYRELKAAQRQLNDNYDPDAMYRALGGEAEARLVQSRMNLTPEERAAQYPWNPDYFKQQTGVGLDDLIHRFDGGEAKSVGFTYPQDAALETARQNGVKMLGLPENNTPMDRAKALGFDTDGFHATGADIHQIDPEKIAQSDYGTIGQGFYIDPSERAGYSNLVAKINQTKAPQNIIPVKYKSDNLYDMTGLLGPNSSEGSKALTANMKASGYDGTFTSLPNGSINEVAVFNPSIVRSRFAAFDPARVNENDLLAGAMPFGLLLDPENRAKLGLGQ